MLWQGGWQLVGANRVQKLSFRDVVAMAMLVVDVPNRPLPPAPVEPPRVDIEYNQVDVRHLVIDWRLTPEAKERALDQTISPTEVNIERTVDPQEAGKQELKGPTWATLTVRQKLYLVMEESHSHPVANAVSVAMMALIIGSILALVMEPIIEGA